MHLRMPDDSLASEGPLPLRLAGPALRSMNQFGLPVGRFAGLPEKVEGVIRAAPNRPKLMLQAANPVGRAVRTLVAGIHHWRRSPRHDENRDLSQRAGGFLGQTVVDLTGRFGERHGAIVGWN